MNTILIKHGNNEPTTENLKNYELGFSDTTKKIYIKAKDEIHTSSFTTKTYLNLNLDKWIINNLKMTDYCSVFIDLDFSNPNLNETQIINFKRADFSYDSHTNTSLTLKPNGIVSSETSSIPILVTVVY